MKESKNIPIILQDKTGQNILAVIKYFAFFSYPLSDDHIWTFMSKEVSRSRIKEVLHTLLEDGKIEENGGYYTLRGHGMIFEERVVREAISQKKVKKLNRMVSILSMFPVIRLIGLSGSCALNNAQEHDDVDFFIITSRERIWTARLLCLTVAHLLGVRRNRIGTIVSDKACFNMFFAVNDMSVPKYKRNLYTAHEVVQMRPLVVRGGVYARFLQANNWIKGYFPNYVYNQDKNAEYIVLEDSGLPTFISRIYAPMGMLIETAARSIQRYFISKHQTTEMVSDTQLWFFPHDFEKKLVKKGLISS